MQAPKQTIYRLFDGVSETLASTPVAGPLASLWGLWGRLECWSQNLCFGLWRLRWQFNLDFDLRIFSSLSDLVSSPYPNVSCNQSELLLDKRVTYTILEVFSVKQVQVQEQTIFVF